MYGVIDLAAPWRVMTPKGHPDGGSLGHCWRYCIGMGNCGIVRLADDKTVAIRPSNHAWRFHP